MQKQIQTASLTGVKNSFLCVTICIVKSSFTLIISDVLSDGVKTCHFDADNCPFKCFLCWAPSQKRNSNFLMLQHWSALTNSTECRARHHINMFSVLWAFFMKSAFLRCTVHGSWMFNLLWNHPQAENLQIMLVKWHIYRFTSKTEGGQWGVCHLLLFGKLKQSLSVCISFLLNLHVNLFDLNLHPHT